MPETEQPPPRDVLRWYTRARRIPRMVGKLPRSEKGLPGGPYTITQMVGGAVTFFTLHKTSWLWSPWGLIGTTAVQIVISLGVIFALRFVKPGGRDPFTALVAVVGVLTASRWGTYRGQSLRPHAPVRVRSRVGIRLPAQVSMVAPMPAAPTEQPSPEPSPLPRPPAVTGVQRLLTSTSRTPHA